MGDDLKTVATMPGRIQWGVSTNVRKCRGTPDLKSSGPTRTMAALTNRGAPCQQRSNVRSVDFSQLGCGKTAPWSRWNASRGTKVTSVLSSATACSRLSLISRA